jgi:hypothetical protein
MNHTYHVAIESATAEVRDTNDTRLLDFVMESRTEMSATWARVSADDCRAIAAVLLNAADLLERREERRRQAAAAAAAK